MHPQKLRSKHCKILRLATKKAATFKFSKVMSHIEHDIESTPVTHASMSVSKTSTRYAFTPFFFFTFLIQLGQIFEFTYLISD